MEIQLLLRVAVGSKADLIPDRLRSCELRLKCLLSGAEEKTDWAGLRWAYLGEVGSREGFEELRITVALIVNFRVTVLLNLNQQ